MVVSPSLASKPKDFEHRSCVGDQLAQADAAKQGTSHRRAEIRKEYALVGFALACPRYRTRTTKWHAHIATVI